MNIFWRKVIFLVEIYRHLSGLGEISAEIFKQILFSFRFAREGLIARSCPNRTTINCQPIIDPSSTVAEY